MRNNSLLEAKRPPSFRQQVYSTYSSNDYERANDAIDPLGSAAEYELEKRLERMERLEVELHKGNAGLGISIVGLGAGQPSGVEKLGIFIKAITPGGAADVDGRMKVRCSPLTLLDRAFSQGCGSD